MSKMNFNLCIHPWIPVVWHDDRTNLVSLEELYKNADEIRDLYLSPIERISVMRLLICITQRALNGPANHKEKANCQSEFISESLEYLQKWQQAFKLYGSDGGFLQVPNLSPLNAKKDKTPHSKLNLSLATGNNPTLYDNAGGNDRIFSPAQLAMSLLTYQNFSPSGKVGCAMWAGFPTSISDTTKGPDKQGSAKDAPCVHGSSLHLFLLGGNLRETIWMNLCPIDCIPTSTFGHPVWESMPQHQNDEKAVKNATETYLGRLVPTSRSIRIEPEGIINGQGLHYRFFNDTQKLLFWEPSNRRVKFKNAKGEDATRLVSLDQHQALWRYLPAMLQSFEGERKKHWLYGKGITLPEHFCIWIGGARIDNYTIQEEIESCFPHSTSILFEEPTYDNLKEALDIAETSKRILQKAINSYYKTFQETAKIKKDGSTKNNKNKSKNTSDENPRHGLDIFWRKLSSVQHLFLLTAQGDEQAFEEWKQACKNAQLQAYDAACPHSTARQIQAWAKFR